jgi:hypothetical protein
MATFKTIKVGKPLNLDDLKKKPTTRSRRTNPRDEDLARLVNEVSVGPASQVLPWHFEGKAATARAAATKVVKAAAATVYVSSRPDMPGILLFSRVPLSGRQGKG